MRGLKLKEAQNKGEDIWVASFTDAWIETTKGQVFKKLEIVASFTDAWIETTTGSISGVYQTVASFTDAWIETPVPTH